jgi:hypothetical protein
MANLPSKTILCVTSIEKGATFMRECKQQGSKVILLTVQKLENADWPREVIDEIFYMPDLYKRDDVILGVSYLARSHQIDCIVALDDLDVEMGATLREHLRIPGMGDTTARHFRDKLAMRVQARDRGIAVPEFIHVLNYDRLREYMACVPPPWLLKPRSDASALGIKKINNSEELWRTLDELGDRQSFYVLEQFIPGDICHVDSIISERQVVFAEAHQYGTPPMSVMHEGKVFTTRTVLRGSPLEKELKEINARMLKELGLVRGVTHAEYIKAHADGTMYFMECGARVGGAHIAELVEASTGVNLWAEWAKIEIAQDEAPYQLPPTRQDYGGMINTLARQEWPDLSAYTDPEIVWRLKRKHHAGLIVASPDYERVKTLLDSYVPRFYQDFFMRLPPGRAG